MYDHFEKQNKIAKQKIKLNEIFRNPVVVFALVSFYYHRNKIVLYFAYSGGLLSFTYLFSSGKAW